jgi:hypothetical protein
VDREEIPEEYMSISSSSNHLENNRSSSLEERGPDNTSLIFRTRNNHWKSLPNCRVTGSVIEIHDGFS